MTENDLTQIKQLINEGFEQLVLPHLDRIYQKLDEHSKILDEHTKILDEHTKVLEEHTNRFDQIERKLDSEIGWRNGASKRLRQVEIKLGLAK